MSFTKILLYHHWIFKCSLRNISMSPLFGYSIVFTMVDLAYLLLLESASQQLGIDLPFRCHRVFLISYVSVIQLVLQMTFVILYCWGFLRRGHPRCWLGQNDPGNRFIVHLGRVDTRSLAGLRGGAFYLWCSLEWSSSFFGRNSASAKRPAYFGVDYWFMDSDGAAGPCSAVVFEMKNPIAFHPFWTLMWGLLHHVVDRPSARQHYQVHEFDAISRS